MIIENSQLFSTLDPAKKDAKWANDCVTVLRRNWIQLKNTLVMRNNKEIIFAQQSMEKIKKSFKDKEFIKNTEFVPIAAWPRILNVIIEELLKNPPQAEVRANDSTALTDKQYDLRLLRLKSFFEREINTELQKVGEPPIVIGGDKFNTNIEEFYRAGLNPQDQEDIDFYEQNDFPRLKYEIVAQKILDAVMKINRFDEELIRDAVLDICSGLCFCVQTYVDAVTGEIKYDHIYPEEAYGIWGNKRDGSDDVGKGWVKNLTVRDWLARVGNEFSFEKNWTQLLWAINYTNRTTYTGFVRYGNRYDAWGNEALMNHPESTYNNAPQSNLLDYSLSFTYNIYSAYMEWDSPEATATYLAKYGTGEMIPKQVPFDLFLDEKKESKEYYKESYYRWAMYKTYFLPTSSTTQWIYNWGKLYMQQLEGAYDQYCKGTLMYYRLEGNSAAELTIPYIEFANLCYYRMKWIVYHSKPTKEQHVIEELIKVSKSLQRLYPQTAQGTVPTVDTILQQLITWKRENFIDLRSYPEIEGKTFPQLAPQTGERGGIDPLALGLQAIEQWLEMQIAEKVGLNDMRLGQIQNPREGFKKGMQETQASLNSTGYIYRMVQLQKEHTAITTLNYAQDIIKFKDTIPYKWLQNLLGEAEFQNIKVIKDFCAHRMGIFIEDISLGSLRERITQLADLYIDKQNGNGGISVMEWGILMATKDPKDALRKLALYTYLLEKKKRKQEMQLLQAKQQNDMQLKQAEGQLQQAKDGADIEKENIKAKAVMYVADRNYESKVHIKQMTTDSEPMKQDTRTQSQKEIIQEKAAVKNQEPLTQ